MEIGALGSLNAGGANKIKGACFRCGREGHRKADCRANRHKEGHTLNGDKSGGKAYGKGGKGGKGGGKADGKGKKGKQWTRKDTKTEGECHRCGKKGHFKQDCWSKFHKNGTQLSAITQEETEPETEVGGLVCLNMVQPKDRASSINEPTSIDGLRSIRIGIDSGAGVSVWPKELCQDYPTRETEASRNKVSYASAGAGEKKILNEGERQLQLQVGPDMRTMRAQVAKVRKPLVSVSEMCKAGHDVHFLADGKAYAGHCERGAVTPFINTKGIFEIEAMVPPYQGGSGHP